MSKTEKNVIAALNVIAKVFNDPVQSADGTVTNQMAFVQERVLGGICRNLAFTLNGTSRYNPTTHQHEVVPGTRAKYQEAVDKAKRAYEMDRGDEIGGRNTANALRWLERIENQKVALEFFYDHAIEAYARHVGKPFVEPTTQSEVRANPQTTSRKSAAAEALRAKLGISTNDIPVTDGVDDIAKIA